MYINWIVASEIIFPANWLFYEMSITKIPLTVDQNIQYMASFW